jgi:hypothetical protein
MKIEIEAKSVFGATRIYPLCDKAKNLCMLMGKLTISKKELELIQKIGFEVECRQMSIDELKKMKIT